MTESWNLCICLYISAVPSVLC